jgi:hypothetical protein
MIYENLLGPFPTVSMRFQVAALHGVLYPMAFGLQEEHKTAVLFYAFITCNASVAASGDR